MLQNLKQSMSSMYTIHIVDVSAYYSIQAEYVYASIFILHIYIYRSIHIEIHFSPQEVKHSKVIRSTQKKCCLQEDVQFSKTQHRDVQFISNTLWL